MDKFVEVLISSGPAGLVAAVLLYLLISERRDHKETRKTLTDTVNKFESLVEKSVEAMTQLTVIIKERMPKN